MNLYQEHQSSYDKNENWIISILSKYVNVLDNVGNTLIYSVIPFSALIVLNGLICHRLRKAYKQRLSMAQQQQTQEMKQERAITRTLLTVVIVLLLARMPFAVLQVISYFLSWYEIRLSIWGYLLVSLSTSQRY